MTFKIFYIEESFLKSFSFSNKSVYSLCNEELRKNSLKWDKVSIKLSLKCFFVLFCFELVLLPISFILLGKKLNPES